MPYKNFIVKTSTGKKNESDSEIIKLRDILAYGNI